MSKTEMTRVRIKPDLKNEVENFFAELRLNPTAAILNDHNNNCLFDQGMKLGDMIYR